MKITIDATHYFKQRMKKLAKKRPSTQALLRSAMILLTQNEYPPQSLKIHKLKGELSNLYAFSLTYNLRVTFMRQKNKIILTNIGSHGEVY